MTDDWFARGKEDFDRGVPRVGAPGGPNSDEWLRGWDAAKNSDDEQEEQRVAASERLCCNCRWWDRQTLWGSDHGSDTALCRLLAPDHRTIERWPRTAERDWCSYFEPRLAD